MTVEVLHTGEVGTVYGWRDRGCRCPECEAAVRVKNRKKIPSPRPTGGQIRPLPEHGTRARYNHNREPCRCPECREANRLSHYVYTDGRPKPRRTVDPDRPRPSRAKPAAPKRVATPVVERAAVAKPLRIVGVPAKPRAVKPVAYVPPAVDVCGLDLPGGGFCARRLPCARHEHGMMSA